MKEKSLKTTIIIIVAVIVAVTGVFVGVFFTATKDNGEPKPIETPPKITPVITPGGETPDPSEQPEVVEPKTVEYDISFEKTEEDYYSAELSGEQQSVLLSYAAGEFSASLTAENDKKEEITMKYFLEYDADGVNYSDGYSDTGKGDYNVGFVFSQKESSKNSVVATAKTAVDIEFSLTATASRAVSDKDDNGVVTYRLTKANSVGTFSDGEENSTYMLMWELSASEVLPTFVSSGKKLGGKLNDRNIEWLYSEMPCSYTVYNPEKTPDEIIAEYYTHDEVVTIEKVSYRFKYVCSYRQYKLSGGTTEFNAITYICEKYKKSNNEFINRQSRTLSLIIYAPSPCTLVFNAK